MTNFWLKFLVASSHHEEKEHEYEQNAVEFHILDFLNDRVNGFIGKPLTSLLVVLRPQQIFDYCVDGGRNRCEIVLFHFVFSYLLILL